MRVKKRRSDLDHSVFVLRNRECDQEVNQSKCKAETGPADKQVEDAQFPAVLQKAVCTAPAQKNSKQDIDPLIYLVAGAVPSQGISAELRRTGVSVFVLDMGLNSFDWSENNSNLPTGDRPFRFLKVCHGS